MSELDPILEVLRGRADELKAQGPGRVVVGRISHINDVRVLRECREALTTDEQFDIRQAVIEMESHLHGIVVEVTQAPTGLGQRLRGMLGGASSNVDAAPIPLPPPKALLDAAEAWMIAELAKPRVDVDFGVLTDPWLAAQVIAE